MGSNDRLPLNGNVGNVPTGAPTTCFSIVISPDVGGGFGGNRGGQSSGGYNQGGQGGGRQQAAPQNDPWGQSAGGSYDWGTGQDDEPPF